MHKLGIALTVAGLFASHLEAAPAPAAPPSPDTPVPASRPAPRAVPSPPPPPPAAPSAPETSYAGPSRLQDLPARDDAPETPWDRLQGVMSERLEIGLRVMHYRLTDSAKTTRDEESNVVGGYTSRISLYRLEEKQNYLPLPYARWKFNPYVAAELAFYDFRARTDTIWDGHTDGDVLASGPALQLLGRYPNETPFTPFAGLGMTWLSTDFDYNAAFHENGLRRIELEDTQAFIWSVGCSVAIQERWQADVALYGMNTDIDAHYSMSRDGGQTILAEERWTFPFSNWAFVVGLKYAF